MVYEDNTIDRSTVGRWAKRTAAEKGHADVHDRPRCGRPQSARTEATIEKANDIIAEDRRVTVAENPKSFIILYTVASPLSSLRDNSATVTRLSSAMMSFAFSIVASVRAD